LPANAATCLFSNGVANPPRLLKASIFAVTPMAAQSEAMAWATSVPSP
jgi:hypothetical protein